MEVTFKARKNGKEYGVTVGEMYNFYWIADVENFSVIRTVCVYLGDGNMAITTGNNSPRMASTLFTKTLAQTTISEIRRAVF